MNHYELSYYLGFVKHKVHNVLMLLFLNLSTLSSIIYLCTVCGREFISIFQFYT